MPGTKIINVLKDDRFEDILHLFQTATAQEVIFVMPPKSKFLNDESHFTVLSAAAEEQNKNILILSSNPKITELAMQYNFGVLSNEKKTKKSPQVKAIAQSNMDEEEDQDELEEESRIDDVNTNEDAGDFDVAPVNTEPATETIYGLDREAETDTGDFVAKEMVETEYNTETADKDIPPEENYQIVSAARMNRTLDDIVKPHEEEQTNSVRISKKVEKPLDVPIRTEHIPQIKEDDAVNQIQKVWQSKKDIWSQPTEESPIESQRQHTRMKMPRILPKKVLTLLGSATIILLGIVIYVSTGSAHIIIKPRINPLDLNVKISVSDSYQDIDSELKKIPGQLFSINKSIEQNFPATGERDVAQKARGKITIYNKYGTSPQVLIATTRLASENGLIFHTLTTVTVPGTTVKNGEITPGMIEVDVIADKAGDSYNISAGKFNIPAFKEKGDNDRYQKFYGVSEEAMKGGIIGKAKVITEQDFVAANQIMAERIKKESETELQNQTAGLKILVAPQPDMEEIRSDSKVDEAIDNFTMTASAKIQTVGFKESDLFLFISQYIEKANNLMIIPEKLKLEFESVQFDKESHKLEFTLLVKGPAYGKVNQNKIISDLLGTNEGEITKYIKGIDSVTSARVLLSPFWVRKVPQNKDKVKITIEYD